MTIEIFDLWSDVKKVNFDSFTENPTLQDGGIVCPLDLARSVNPISKEGGGGRISSLSYGPANFIIFHHHLLYLTLKNLPKSAKTWIAIFL